MKLFIKQILISFLFLTISLGGCGDFEGNYEDVETDYNSTNSVKFVAVGGSGTVLTSSDGSSSLNT